MGVAYYTIYCRLFLTDCSINFLFIDGRDIDNSAGLNIFPVRHLSRTLNTIFNNNNHYWFYERILVEALKWNIFSKILK